MVVALEAANVGPVTGIEARYGLPFGGRWLRRRLQILLAVSYFRMFRVRDEILRPPAMPQGLTGVRELFHTVAVDIGLGYEIAAHRVITPYVDLGFSLLHTYATYSAYSAHKVQVDTYPGLVVGIGLRFHFGPGAAFLDARFRLAEADLGALGEQTAQSQSGMIVSAGYGFAF